MTELIPLFVAVPLGLAFISLIFSKFIKRSSDVLAFLGMAYLLYLSIKMIGIKSADYLIGKFEWPLGIQLHVDQFSVVMLLIVQVIGILAIFYSLSYMERYTSKPKFMALFLLMIAGMNGVIITADIFNLYVFLEIASLASYALVGFGVGSEELEASFKYLILGCVASAMILLGIGILYSYTGSLNLSDIAMFLPTHPVGKPIFFVYALFLMGFGLKAAMVPFHAWLPDAHPSAPAPISAMLSGVLIKALGFYTIARLFFGVFGINEMIGYILLVLGTLSMIVGGLLAVGQWDIKRQLAYSSISQMGYIVIGLAVGALAESQIVRTLGIAGAIYHAINHATFKTALFLSSGAIEYGTGTRDMKKLGGLFHKMPITATTTAVASLSIAGVPPLNGFWSKLIIIIALIQAKQLLVAGLAIFISFITLIYFIKLQRFSIFGPVPENMKTIKEVPFTMKLTLIILAIMCLGLGVAYPFLQDFLQEASIALQTILKF